GQQKRKWPTKQKWRNKKAPPVVGRRCFRASAPAVRRRNDCTQAKWSARQGEALVAFGNDFLAFLAVGLGAAQVGHDALGLALDVGAEIPGVAARRRRPRALGRFVAVLDPGRVGILPGLGGIDV